MEKGIEEVKDLKKKLKADKKAARRKKWDDIFNRIDHEMDGVFGGVLFLGSLWIMQVLVDEGIESYSPLPAMVIMTIPCICFAWGLRKFTTYVLWRNKRWVKN